MSVTIPGFYLGAKDMNPGSQLCMALLTEPSFHPLYWLFLSCSYLLLDIIILSTYDGINVIICLIWEESIEAAITGLFKGPCGSLTNLP